VVFRLPPRDTTAPSAVTWKANYGRLGTGRLGTVITRIYFVVGDNPNTTQTPEDTKDKYNVKIIK
jgi:hypothetical protein